MENFFDKKIKRELSEISRDEKEIIRDIRGINFGRLVVFIQNGVVISKEITMTVKTKREKNNNPDFKKIKENSYCGLTDN